MLPKDVSREEPILILGFGALVGAIGYSAQTYFLMWFFFWRDADPVWPIDLGQRMFWWTMPVGAVLGLLTAKSFNHWRVRRFLTATWIVATTGSWTVAIALCCAGLYFITDPHRNGWFDVVGRVLALSVSWGLPFWWGLALLGWSRYIRKSELDWKAHQALREYFDS